MYKTLFIITLFYSSLVFAGQWQIQNSGVTFDLKDICFIDSLNGWAAGDSGTILTTSDGGENWILQITPVDTIKLYNIQFVDKDNGFVVGDWGTFLATKNGGETWTQYDCGVNYLLEGLSFVNKDTGWIAGCDMFQSRLSGIILHTKNGGQSWETQLETYSPSIFSAKLLRAVQFIDANNGCAIGGDYFDNYSSTYLYHTCNGGRDWNITSTILSNVYKMSMVSLDTIWACGIGLASTFDCGKNWNYTSHYYGNTSAVTQINGKTVWIYEAHLQERAIFFTNDAGASWQTIEMPENSSFSALTNDGIRSLWGAGRKGYIAKYVEEVTSISGNNNQLPLQCELAQNYPNPFNSETTINFSLSKTNYVHLTIYDPSGRQVNSLVSKTMPPGTYHVSWNGCDLAGKPVSSGIYFYSLQTNNQVYTKRALLLR